MLSMQGSRRLLVAGCLIGFLAASSLAAAVTLSSPSRAQAGSPDASEPNDTPATARVLMPGEEASFTLTPRLDRDVFAVTAPAAGVLTMSLLSVPAVHKPYVRWLDADGNVLRDNEADIRVEAGATAYLEVRSNYWSAQEVASNEPLKLRVDFVTQRDNFEPNDTIADAKPLPVDKPITITLTPRGDVDCFRFDAATETRLVVETLSLPPGLKPFIRWLRDDGVVIAEGRSDVWVDRGTSAFLEISADRWQANRQSWPEPISLRVSAVADDDPFEPNDDSAHASQLALDRRITARLLGADEDHYRLRLDEGSYLADFNPREALAVTWQDSAGNVLAEGRKATVVTGPSDVEVTVRPAVSASGQRPLRYELKISRLGTSRGPGLYPRDPPNYVAPTVPGL